MGLAGRKLGLACDRLRSVRIVTADGRALHCDANNHSDLFWALRGGGGGNFGIVTQFELAPHAVSQASWFVCSYPWAAAADALDAWQRLLPGAPGGRHLDHHARDAAAAARRVTALGQYFGSESELPPHRHAAHRGRRRLADDGHERLPRPDAPLGRLPARGPRRLPHRGHAAGRRPGARALRRQVRLRGPAAERGRPPGAGRGRRTPAEHARRGIGRARDRLLRRRREPRGAGPHRLHPSRPALLGAGDRLLRGGRPGRLARLAALGARRAAAARLGPGIPELHRPGARQLAPGLLRGELRPADAR